MKFLNMKKVQEGNYIARYDIVYETGDGKDKIYEMISRDKNMKSYQDLTGRGGADHA